MLLKNNKFVRVKLGTPEELFKKLTTSGFASGQMNNLSPHFMRSRVIGIKVENAILTLGHIFDKDQFGYDMEILFALPFHPNALYRDIVCNLGNRPGDYLITQYIDFGYKIIGQPLNENDPKMKSDFNKLQAAFVHHCQEMARAMNSHLR